MAQRKVQGSCSWPGFGGGYIPSGSYFGTLASPICGFSISLKGL